MLKILLPVAGTERPTCGAAVIKRFANDSAMEVHLLNVQLHLTHCASYSSRRSRNEFHREQAEGACAWGRCSTGTRSRRHIEVGDRRHRHVAAARRLRCTRS
jgi:hypothetical protein